MVETTGLEKIIYCISNQVDEILDNHSEELAPDVYEDLLMCSELSNKLLNYDYFKKSESILNNYKLDTKLIKRWDLKQKKELKEKKNDLRQLFKLIVNNLEEI